MKNIKQKILFYSVFFIFITLFSAIVSIFIDSALSNNIEIFLNGNFNIKNLISIFFGSEKILQLFAICEIGGFLIIAYMIMQQKSKRNNVAEKREVARGIKTPVPVGEGQYGTARFMEKKEIDEVYDKVIIDKNNPEIKKLMLEQQATPFLENSGLVVNFEKKGNKEFINYIGDDVHTLTVGATRSGKTRRTCTSNSTD